MQKVAYGYGVCTVQWEPRVRKGRIKRRLPTKFQRRAVRRSSEGRIALIGRNSRANHGLSRFVTTW